MHMLKDIFKAYEKKHPSLPPFAGIIGGKNVLLSSDEAEWLLSNLATVINEYVPDKEAKQYDGFYEGVEF